MCRILAVRSSASFTLRDYLESFARLAFESVEYQGHGWGCSFLREGRWKHYRNLQPIWTDRLDRFGKTDLLVAHARSAFQNRVFAFNGELRGVRLKIEGRIGAEKIFRLVQRLDEGDLKEGIRRAIRVLERRTAELKACNFVIADPKRLWLATIFNERPDYFTLHMLDRDPLVVCSKPLGNERGWRPLPSGTIEEFS